MKKTMLFLSSIFFVLTMHSQTPVSPKNHADAEILWSQVDKTYSSKILSNSEGKYVPIAVNFKPCPKNCVKDENPCEFCSCGGGICNALYISEDVDEDDIDEGVVLVQNIGNGNIEITFTDRVAYDENMNVLIGERVVLDENICELLGFGSSTAELTYGNYKIMPTPISKYGRVIVKYQLANSTPSEDSDDNADIDESEE